MSSLIYEWTNNKILSDDRVSKFVEYCRSNKKYLIVLDDYIFDYLSLSELVNLKDCLYCENYQKHNCCCGNSYTMPDDVANRIKENSESIIKVIPSNDRLNESFKKYGTLTPNNSTTTKGSDKGYCIFSYKDKDFYKCAIHKWCIDNGLNYLDYKPYPCSLFPIQGIRLTNNKVFVFSMSEKTAGFSMFFYSLRRRICVNYSNALKVQNDERSKSKYLQEIDREKFIEDNVIERYRPVYVEQETVMRHFIGNSIYDRLIEKIKEI